MTTSAGLARMKLGGAALGLLVVGVALCVLRLTVLPKGWGRWVASKWALLTGLAILFAVLTMFLPAVLFAVLASIAYAHREREGTTQEGEGETEV